MRACSKSLDFLCSIAITAIGVKVKTQQGFRLAGDLFPSSSFMDWLDVLIALTFSTNRSTNLANPTDKTCFFAKCGSISTADRFRTASISRQSRLNGISRKEAGLQLAASAAGLPPDGE
jgi:hypothetical protein